MTPEQIKKIREALRLTQDDLATILGVTKHTVWRYEDGRGEPGNDVTAKLLNLEASLKNAHEEEQLKKLRKTPGGVAAIAAVTALGSALSVGAAGAPVVGCAGIAMSVAGQSLLSFLGECLEGPDAQGHHGSSQGAKRPVCGAGAVVSSMIARGMVRDEERDNIDFATKAKPVSSVTKKATSESNQS